MDRKKGWVVSLWVLLMIHAAFYAQAQDNPLRLRHPLAFKQNPELAKPLTTAQAVIDHYLEAIGGRDKVEAIRSLMIEGTHYSADNQVLRMRRYHKGPNLMRQQVQGTPAFQLVLGNEIWHILPGRQLRVTAPHMLQLVHLRLDNNFLNYQQRHIRYRFRGVKTLNQNPFQYYHLTRTFPGGYREELYFETQSGLLHLVKEEGGKVLTTYQDYRRFNGLLFPCLRVRSFKKFTPPHVFSIDKVEVNQYYSDAFFSIDSDPLTTQFK